MRWTLGEWKKVRNYLIKQIHQYLPSIGKRRDILGLHRKLGKARNGEVKTKEKEKKLINNFFSVYEDNRLDTELIWIFIAQALDMDKINRRLGDF